MCEAGRRARDRAFFHFYHHHAHRLTHFIAYSYSLRSSLQSTCNCAPVACARIHSAAGVLRSSEWPQPRPRTLPRHRFLCHLTASTRPATAKRTSISSQRPSQQVRARRAAGSLGHGSPTSYLSQTAGKRSASIFHTVAFPRATRSAALARRMALSHIVRSTGRALEPEGAEGGRGVGLPRLPGLATPPPHLTPHCSRPHKLGLRSGGMCSRSPTRRLRAGSGGRSRMGLRL